MLVQTQVPIHLSSSPAQVALFTGDQRDPDASVFGSRKLDMAPLGVAGFGKPLPA